MRAISQAELIAVATQRAAPETERRVLLAALHDPAVGHELEAIRQLSRRQPRDLSSTLQHALDAVAREWDRTRAPWWQPFWGRVQQVLVLEMPKPLTLPLLAPALAASPERLTVQREVFEKEGVRVELQQLPGSPARLRCVVDATACVGPAHSVALAFQEEGSLPFVMVIALGAQKIGLREWELGGEGTEVFPTPKKPLVLLELALLEER